MPSNSSESEATTRLSVKADEWWWGGAVADDQEMPFGRVAHRRNLATSAGFADNDHAGADQSARLLVSSAGRYIRLVSSTVQFPFDGEGVPELDSHDIVLGEEGTTLAPWRVLDDRHLSAVRAAVDTHQALKPDLSALFDHAAKTAEPILRPLAYDFPGYEAVRDQFLLGEEILCPPVLESGAPTRPVLVAPGRPQGSDGSVTGGPAEIVLEVDLESMPYRRKIIN